MMPKVYVTRREVFSSAHRLFNSDWDENQNEEIFGKCNNFYGHGHNYTLEVTVFGEANPETGYVVDLKKLKDIIREKAKNHLDHKHLNYDVDYFKTHNPTAENIAIYIWKMLENEIPSGKLYSVKIYETENNYAEYRGE